ncbi:MAG: MFS transporter [Chloroflexota bacterium]
MEKPAEPQQTSTGVYILYGAGMLGSAAIGFVSSSWLLYYYLPPGAAGRVPAAFFGAATLVSYLASAVLIPLIGYLSDALRSPWGRRLPFMSAAALPVAVLFVLLWTPPLTNQSLWNLVYLTVMLVLFKIASGFYQIPYQALLPELALSDHARVRLSAWQSGFLLTGFMLGGLAGPVIEKFGYQGNALIYAGAALVSLSLPLLVARRGQQAVPPSMQPGDFWRSMQTTLRNQAFLVFAVCWALYLMTSFAVQSSAPFLTTEVCLLSPSDTVFFYIPAILTSLGSYPLVTWLSDRFGKWRVFASSLLVSALVFPGTMLIGPWLPLALKAQCTTWAILQAFSVSGATVLGATFVAEIADYQASTTGQHNAGIYYALMKLLDQVLSGVASALLPLLFLLGRSRSAPQGPLGVRLTGVAAGILVAAAFLVFLRYPLRPGAPVASQQSS